MYVTGSAQDKDFNKNITIGVYTNIGVNKLIRFTSKYVTGQIGPFHSMASYCAGLNISRSLSRNIRIEIAACYSLHKVGFELSPPIYTDSKIYTETFETVNIPIIFYRYLKNNYFLRLGTITDFSLTRNSEWIDTQSGFGMSIGAGKEICINNFSINLTPNLEIHSLLPFNSFKDKQRLFVLGLGIGFRYNPPLNKRDESND
jgi:hypothetical protein